MGSNPIYGSLKMVIKGISAVTLAVQDMTRSEVPTKSV